MKRITALTGMVVALMVTAAPVAAAAAPADGDVCNVMKRALFLRIACE